MSDSNAANQGLLAQNEALTNVARALWAQLPDDCDRIVCQALVFADYSEYRKTAYRPDGSEQHISADYNVVKAVNQLRQVMYVPEKGTWYTADFAVARPGQLSSDFNYDDEPDWSVKPTDETYRADNEAFPRRADLIPDWMKAKLA